MAHWERVQVPPDFAGLTRADRQGGTYLRYHPDTARFSIQHFGWGGAGVCRRRVHCLGSPRGAAPVQPASDLCTPR